MLPLVLALLTAIALFYAALWVFQERFIYFPRGYSVAVEQLPAPIVALHFETGAGEQTAFYLPPRSGTRARLWIVFGGNAMTALDWTDWAVEHPDPDAAFLLVEYPGYGYSKGSPSRARINDASDAAFATLAAYLGTDPAKLASQTYLLGHSLGAATALEFAGRHTPQGLVLTAPFTTLRDVAAGLFGPPVRPLVRENYDNIARLSELGRRGVPAVIVHGHNDEIIAYRFGARLAKGAPWVKFVAVPGAGHNDLYEVAAREVRTAMLEVSRTDGSR